ncbi:MAG: hypothetical protein AAFX52_09635 [Pseudomonadota bacterium]
MVQILRAVVIVVGLVMTVAGCYFVMVGLGVPVEELTFGFGAFSLSSGNLSAGIVFSVFGTILIFIAAQHMKRRKETTVDGASITTHEVNM